MLGKETTDSFNTGESRGARVFPQFKLPEVRQGAYDAGRDRGHGWREMYLAGARGAPVLFG